MWVASAEAFQDQPAPLRHSGLAYPTLAALPLRAGVEWGCYVSPVARRQALLSTCLKTYSEESQMKRQRAPYATRSVWSVIAVLSIVLVAGCVAAGYEIYHLQTEVNGLQTQVNGLYPQVNALYQAVLNLAQSLTQIVK